MSLDLYNKVLERFASMEARPEMWAGTREAFGLQLVAFAEAWLDLNAKTTAKLMHLVFAGRTVITSAPLDAAWAKLAVAAARAFVSDPDKHGAQAPAARCCKGAHVTSPPGGLQCDHAEGHASRCQSTFGGVTVTWEST